MEGRRKEGVGEAEEGVEEEEKVLTTPSPRGHYLFPENMGPRIT